MQSFYLKAALTQFVALSAIYHNQLVQPPIHDHISLLQDVPTQYNLNDGSTGMALANLTSLIAYVQYKGQWKSNQQAQQYNFLTEPQGDSFMIFLTNSTNYFFHTQEAIIQDIDLQMLNPTYPEGREVFSLVQLGNYSAENMTFSGTGFMNYSGYQKFKQKVSSSGECLVDYKLQVTFSDPTSPSYENCNINFQVVSQSPASCSVDFQVNYTLDTTNYQLQVIFYCLFVNIVCAIQFICVTKLCKEFLENDEDVQRISLITVGCVTVYDSYLCLQNLYFALLNYIFFQYFIIPAFFYFLLSTTCDMKLIWIVWRARYVNEIVDNQMMRRAVAIYFVQFYASLIVFFVLMYFFELDNWFILLNSLFLLPQIIHNAVRGNNPKFIPEYIFGVLASNILYPLYFRGCPSNFRGLQPSLIFCVSWTSLYLIQIFFLFIQYKFGPRSFIPRFLLPKQYNYYHNLAINDDDEIDDCAICLGSLLMEPDQMEVNLTSKFVTRQIMVTPCKHKFHIKCLHSWMDVKLNCPTCRKSIPAINPQ